MAPDLFFRKDVEAMDRDDLDALSDARIRHTIHYAAEHSPFYRRWFSDHRIDPDTIKCHEDLLNLPIISGATLREAQPPYAPDFAFRSSVWEEIFTVHETSGTSGTPKSFFLTWDDWSRYAEKYARIFVSQGFSRGDRVIMCTSYGMNVGANTMTLAARDVGMAVIPTGKCTFPTRMITAYRPTAIVGSVFKLLHLAKRMTAEGIPPQDSSVERLVVGGESFAEESRAYLSEVWGCEAFNTYGSTEGTMCGECSQKSGLHVPEDLVHLDLYDPLLKSFVSDRECGRIILTTLLAPGEHCGNLLINYDTEDTSGVVSRDRCHCGRTHLRIYTPQREAETVWVAGTPFNKVDIERGVFSVEHMDLLTGEYEAFLYPGDEEGDAVLRVSLETSGPVPEKTSGIEDHIRESLLAHRPRLASAYADGTFQILFHFKMPGELELSRLKGRPRRLVDRR
jgi:coenzyme F390 synthetase